MKNFLLGIKVIFRFFMKKGRNFWGYGMATIAIGVSMAMMFRSALMLIMDLLTLGFIHPGYLGMFMMSFGVFVWCLGYLEGEDDIT